MCGSHGTTFGQAGPAWCRGRLTLTLTLTLTRPRVVQGAALLAYLLHGVESEVTPKGGWMRVEPKGVEGTTTAP